MKRHRAQTIRAERGGSKLNTLFTLAILGSMIFVGIKIVPVYFAKYQMQDAIETESKFALVAYPRKSIDDIRADIYKKAVDLGVPTKEEDIQINVSNTNVEIIMDYSVPIDLAVYQWAPEFHLHADNHTI
jgi:hypothetical protein